MYKIPYEIAHHLVTHTKSPQILQPGDSVDQPFVAKNHHSIGYMDPGYTLGTEFDYIVESDFPIRDEFTMPYEPSVSGFWLHRKEELQNPTEPIKILQGFVDPNSTGEEQLDITDCCVVVPSPVNKLTCVSVNTLERLLELEPDLKQCLQSEQNNEKLV